MNIPRAARPQRFALSGFVFTVLALGAAGVFSLALTWRDQRLAKYNAPREKLAVTRVVYAKTHGYPSVGDTQWNQLRLLTSANESRDALALRTGFPRGIPTRADGLNLSAKCVVEMRFGEGSAEQTVILYNGTTIRYSHHGSEYFAGLATNDFEAILLRSMAAP